MIDQAESLRKMVAQNDEKSGPKIITVTSGKGGVGKSNLVINLALALQKDNNKVMIFDADIGMANDDVLMGCIAKYSIYDIIFNNKEIDDVIIEGPYGLKLLPGGSGLNRVDQLTDEQRNKFLNKLEKLEDLDFLFIDTGAGVSRDILGFISCASEVIIVTTPEPTSITDSYSLLKTVNHFKIKDSAKLVINKCIFKGEGDEIYRKFSSVAKKFLDMDVEYLGSIEEDRKVISSVRSQKPFILNEPKCEASKCVEKICDKLQGQKMKNENITVKSMFRKMFDIFS
jgi:flagellar biosynthesis protein FlhG